MRSASLSLVFVLSGSLAACGSSTPPEEALNPSGGGLDGGFSPGDDSGPGTGIQPDGGSGSRDGTEIKKAGGPDGVPFDPKGEGSFGVKKDPSGAIVLDPKDYGSGSAPLIWIANSEEGTVSKIDTRTMKELARYRTGPDPAESTDPSRTTVGLNGDVVVVNRAGSSATKIAANPVNCVGAGTGTSKGGTDVRRWGDDTCVLWNTAFPKGSLGRAGAFDAEKGADGELSTSVWVGLYNTSKMLQLDSKTGAIRAEVDVAPLNPYGAAIDKDHNVWIWGDQKGIGRIFAPTKKFTRITDSPCGYGIAADSKGRVWTSGADCVARYNPTSGKWDSQNGVGTQNRGLALDGRGSVWIADTKFGVQQVSEDTLKVIKSIEVPSSGGEEYVGMAVDFDGMIWTINERASEATKIDPKTYKTTPIKVGVHPYTYSDMTGFQLRNAASPFGQYIHPFKGCGINNQWTTLSWTSTIAPGTTIRVRVRTASDKAGLVKAPWTLVATQPPDKPPIDLKTVLGDKSRADFMEVEFTLSSPSPTVTPVLSSIDASSGCRITPT